MKTYLTLIAMLWLASVSPAEATVGGGRYYSDFYYQPGQQQVWFLYHDYSGRGCPPELHAYDLGTQTQTTLVSCDAMMNELYEAQERGESYPAEYAVFKQRHLQAAAASGIQLQSIDLNLVPVDFAIEYAGGKQWGPSFVYGDSYDSYDVWYNSALQWTITPVVDGLARPTASVSSCFTDDRNQVNFRGFSAPEWDGLFVTATTISQCYEYGYIDQVALALDHIIVPAEAYLGEERSILSTTEPWDQTVKSDEGDILAQLDTLSIAHYLNDVGFQAYQDGSFVPAMAHFLAAHEWQQQHGHDYLMPLFNLAATEAKTGLADDAFVHLEELLAHTDQRTHFQEKVLSDEDFTSLQSSSRFQQLVYGAIRSFPDVPGDHQNADAIAYVHEEGIVQGYPDGTYRPEQTINRAEFTKIIVNALWPLEMTEQCNTVYFPDVPRGEWFFHFVCRARDGWLLTGYPDGTFKPGDPINFVEAAKIISNGFGLVEQLEHCQGKLCADVDAPGQPWYERYVQALQERSAIPSTIDRLDKAITRGEMTELIWRIKADVRDRPSAQFEIADQRDCLEWQGADIPGVDMHHVRQVWLNWMNAQRAKEGLAPYSYNRVLNATALEWSQFSADRLIMSHQRPGQEAYYDYGIITQWFVDRGVTFANINRVTYSENIGRGPYRCTASDCTQSLLDAIDEVFDFYMAEKDKEYQPHYTSVMNAYFTQIGMGVVIGEDGNFYITTHYGTEVSVAPSHQNMFCTTSE